MSNKLLLINLGVIGYMLVFMFWAMGGLSFDKSVILVLHPIGMVASFYLLFKVFKHASTNPSLQGGRAFWMMCLLAFSPVSWLIYILKFKNSFDETHFLSSTPE